MACPYLKGIHALTCTVNGIDYIPSQFELEEYCQSSKAEKCPYPSLALFGIAYAANGDTGKKKRVLQKDGRP